MNKILILFLIGIPLSCKAMDNDGSGEKRALLELNRLHSDKKMRDTTQVVGRWRKICQCHMPTAKEGICILGSFLALSVFGMAILTWRLYACETSDCHIDQTETVCFESNLKEQIEQNDNQIIVNFAQWLLNRCDL